MILLMWGTILLVALILYYNQTFGRFKKYGVKYFSPLPLVGNVLDLILKRRHIKEQLEELYHNFPEERFVGRYEFSKPIVVVRDLELIKNVTVKNFEHFIDRRALVNEKLDPVFGRILLSLNGQEWKDMRSTLSPAFTSSKMRSMVPFMSEVSDTMMKILKEDIKKSGVGYVDLDSRDLTTRYANDVIASCAFGLKVNSHADRNNEFYNMGKEVASFGPRRAFIILGYTGFPNLMKKLGLTMLTDKVNNFFRYIILDTMKNRESKNIIRPDMIHLLMESKKGKLSHDEKVKEADTGFATVEESHVTKKSLSRDWSDDDLVAQAVVFLIAGFETVSTAMTFLLYELAINPDIQERLVQEIKEHDMKTDGKFDFNSIQNMTYLDMVVSEVLRKWPPVPIVTRLCVKDYNLGKANSKSSDYIIRKGENLTIPVHSLHHDPEYYPDPKKFNPERFSEQNKHTINPCTYAPFGYGPRNCIGSRFALCEIKVMICLLLKQIEVCPCEKTQIPAKLSRKSFGSRIQGGEWLRFKPRA